MSQKLCAYLGLHLTPGAGSARKASVLREVGDPQVAMQRLGLAPNEATIQQELAQAAKSGTQLIDFEDPLYPFLLKQIADPPLVLYVKGNVQLLQHPVPIALVGARKLTTYGRQAAAFFAKGLSQGGACLVSGLALGTDAEAHEQALAIGGTTIGILGCGIDVVYPRDNKRLFEAMLQSGRGVLVSEFAFGAKPLSDHFPRRNRLISGMSYATVVIEAGAKSGSLITANAANEQGRTVFAVPHSIFSVNAAGSNQLIRKGAQLVTDPQEVFDELAPQMDVPIVPLPNLAAAGTKKKLSDLEQQLLKWIGQGEASDLDRLMLKAGVDPARLLALLTRLEVEGWVKRDPNGRLFLATP